MATPPVDGVKHWLNGLPVDSLQQPTKDTGGTKYWFNGLPMEFLASYAGGEGGGGGGGTPTAARMFVMVIQ